MKKLTLFLLVFIVFVSCESEKNPIGNHTHFVFDCDISNAEFISITNQNGDIIFDTVGTRFKNLIHLDVPPTNKLTVTHGIEHDLFFNLTTYRDVESGFKITDKSDCIVPYVQNSNLRVEIFGISNYSEFYYPLSGDKEIELSTNDNKIILTGIVAGKNDFLLTILPKGSNKYLSFLIKESNFVKVDDKNYTYSININEFKPSTVHKIDLGINLSWIVKTSAIQPSGQNVSLANWTSYLENQNGESIKLFSLPEINLNNIKLNIRNNYSIDGYQYIKSLNGFPDKLDKYDPSIDIALFNISDYNVSNNFDYDLSVIEYDYLKNSWISSWKIFERKSGSITNKLPKISQNILDKITIYSELKDKPHSSIAHFYKFDTPDFNSIYNASSLERSIECYSFNCKFEGKTF